MRDPINILVVDDDENFLKAMEKTLKSKGCFVSLSNNHKKALRFLINKIHHVAFIDCLLQSEQGVNLVRDIRKLLGNSVDIILISGVLSESDSKDIKDLGPVHFIPKPIKTAHINETIQRIESKMVYGCADHTLLKLFKEDVSNKDQLKFLFNLDKESGVNFLLSLVQFLNTKEKGSVKFSLDENLYHEIFFEDCKVVNYIIHNKDIFLRELIKAGHIDEKIKARLQMVSVDELDHEIISQSYATPNSVAKIKEKLLLKVLDEIPDKINIRMTSALFKSSHHFFEKNKESLIKPILALIEKAPESYMKNIFVDDVMKSLIVFSKKEILKDLNIDKSKISLNELKLQGVFKNDKKFQIFVLGQLLTLKAHLQPDVNKHTHIKERFQYLLKNFQDKEPRSIMLSLAQSELLNTLPSPEQLKKIYSSFIKYNHSDNFHYVISEDIKKYSDDVCKVVKKAYNDLTDPKAQLVLKKEEKEKKIAIEIKVSEDRKKVSHLLHNKKYQQALKIILAQEEYVMAEDLQWKILYLWSVYKIKNKVQINSDKTKQIFSSILKENIDTHLKCICFYILGLRHAYLSRDKEAISHFNKVKLADPSFKPVISDLRVLFLRQNKRSTISPMSKLKDIFNKKIS